MRTEKPHPIGVRKRLCVFVLGGKLSIYFLVNIGYLLRPSVVSRRPFRRRRRRPLSVRPVVRRPSSVVVVVVCPSSV